MSKIKFIARCFILSIFIINVNIQNAQSFFMTPPLPFDIELDIPGNINKVVSNVKAVYKKVQTIKTEYQSRKEQLLKKGGLMSMAKDTIGDAIVGTIESEQSKLKTAGKSALENDEELGITKNGLDEIENFDAFHTLFFKFPEESLYSGEYDYPTVKAAYIRKAEDYVEDVIIESYLTGKVNEAYLTTYVEKTIDRLEACQNREAENDVENCVFFGLQYVFVDPTGEEVEEGGEPDESENPGQYGEIMNSYIVSTIYDRLMRIIEDLTTSEAQLNVAKQIKLVIPITPEEDEVSFLLDNNRFIFNYTQENEHAHATSLLSTTKRSDECTENPTSKYCSGLNEASASLENMDDTAILGKLQPIDDLINKAMLIHNVKYKLRDHKFQYRQYLKAKEIWEKTMDVLKKSDECAVSFMDRHAVDGVDTQSVWYGNSVSLEEHNDHETRMGTSKELIQAFDDTVTSTIIGESDVCEGFYDTCPSGYNLDTENPCEYEDENGVTQTSTTHFSCLLDTIATDTQKDATSDSGGLPDTDSADYEETDDMKDTDGLVDGSQSETIETENRIKSEKNWRLGYKKLTELIADGILSFDMWNDQKILQSEYLRNKYRNIKMILASFDQAKGSYMIASALNNSGTTEIISLEDLIPAISGCKKPSEAIEDAHLDFCSDYYFRTTGVYYKVVDDEEIFCTIIADDDTGYITATKDGSSKKYDQRITSDDVGGGCYFTQDSYSYTAPDSAEACDENSTWDLTVSFLVKKFLPEILGGCKDDSQAQADYLLYEESNSESGYNKGRRVSADYLEDVIDARTEAEEALQNMVKEYLVEIEDLEQQRADKLEVQKTYAIALNELLEAKNDLVAELERSEGRLTGIKTELANLDDNNGRLEDETLAEYKENYNLEYGCISGTVTSECEDYVVYEASEDTSKYIPVSYIENKIDESATDIENYQNAIETLKDEIAVIDDDISGENENFAVNYVTEATDQQGYIEIANEIFENMLITSSSGEAPDRMRDINNRVSICCYGLEVCPFKLCTEDKTYKTDNLQTTLENIIYSESLAFIIEDEIEAKWASSVGLSLEDYGIDGTFVIATEVFGIDPGTYTVATLIEEIKEKSIKAAVEIISDNITEADEIIGEEVDDAIEEVDSVVTEEMGISGTGIDNTEIQDYIYEINNYDEAGSTGYITTITELHHELIKDLREPTAENASILDQAGIDLSIIFGIPTDIKTDDEYFVALPARGCYEDDGICDVEDDDVSETLKNAGRDYMAPLGPLSQLGPLRESFYFSSMDYSDVPITPEIIIDGRNIEASFYPSITTLLDKKYKGTTDAVDYMPIVWMHLLARPNARDDGKYFQTFIERSFGDDILSSYLGQYDKEDYRVKLTRMGVYPCKLGNYYYDIEVSGNGVSKISFTKSLNAPTDLSYIEECQEINDTGSSSKLYHQLADESESSISYDFESSPGEMYTTHSELGEIISKNLDYREYFMTINEYLLDKDNYENTAKRQMADLSTFKRNIFGSFLDAVNGEYNARKIYESAEEDVYNSTYELCTQIHSLDLFVDNEDETDDSCVEAILSEEGGGLADSIDDAEYYPSCVETTAYYDSIYCNLDGAKDDRIASAQELKNDLDSDLKDFSDDEIARVQERVDEIENYFAALDADKSEITFIQPGATGDSVGSAVITANSNLDVITESEEEGLTSMGDQSRIEAYCPIY